MEEMHKSNVKTEPNDDVHTKKELAKQLQIDENLSKVVDKFGATKALKAAIEEKY